MTTLVVADPGLRSISGHHPAAASRIARCPGFSEILFYGHENPDAGLAQWLAEQGAHLKPHFSVYLYEAYRKPWTLAEAQPYSRALAQDYARLFNDLSAAGDVDILHHTLDWPHLSGLGLAVSRQPSARLNHHVFLMFNPGVGPDGHVWDQKRQLSYKLGLTALAACKNLQLYTSSVELLEVYGRHFGLASRIRLHPVFHFSSQDARPPSKAFVLPEGSQVLLYVGDAKEAKGFVQLPALVQALLQHSRHRLVVQVGLDDRLRSAGVATALAQLHAQAQQSSRLQIIDRYLPEEALQKLLVESDCLVMNYSPVQYAHQTSGLLWQAAAAKLPVVVVGDSWVAREARRVCEQAKVFADLRGAASWLCAAPSQQATVANAAQPGFESYRTALFRPLEQIFTNQGLTAGYESLLLPVDAGAGLGVNRSEGGSAGPVVLFIDARLPDPAASAGGYAAIQEMALFRVLGYQVRFLAVSPSGADAFLRLGLQPCFHYPL